MKTKINSNRTENPPKATTGDTNSIVTLAKERKKMERGVWKRLQQKIGVGLFFDILQQASRAMTDDLEGKEGAPPSLTRSDLFGPDGQGTARIEPYVEEALALFIADDYLFSSDLCLALEEIMDEATFRYFENERAFEKIRLAKASQRRRVGLSFPTAALQDKPAA